MARIFIISNRVSVPQAGLHPGGLEVVLRATLKNHPCVWLGWSGEVNDHPKTRTMAKGDNTYIVSDLTPMISRNITTASPTGCCGRSCITAWIWRNFPAAIYPAICASMNISPTSLSRC